ncbi:RBBP9/YdeN family alpha/beta hydrolase [Deinococcus roseus]|uniref:Alpha/beta hydrolase n=1 Tax=Deinococcus roseus TaxID=392414 RepID=A0ABQ2DAV9_9DEIO|nr:alpha/beta hydrolase [Deinococcus roseus]GGJ50745.1 alpha/beta hydrolase [Deinococcus roseus]
MTRILTVPGWGSSGPEHWQSIWEREHGFQRVEQQDWETPQLRDWVAQLDEAIGQSEESTVLVAHSLGCQAVAHWGCCVINHPVKAVLMVAPPYLDGPDVPAELQNFVPMHLEPLPFQVLVVASSNDPYASLEQAEQLVQAWGGQLVNVGEKGHINSASGLGDWPEGYRLLQALLEPYCVDP